MIIIKTNNNQSPAITPATRAVRLYVIITVIVQRHLWLQVSLVCRLSTSCNGGNYIFKHAQTRLSACCFLHEFSRRIQS